MGNLPIWATTILTNDFEDDHYWTASVETECREAYLALANVLRNPVDVYKYQESIAIYDKYIGDIIDYYGGMMEIEAYAREYEAWPPGYFPRPKLKIKKRNMSVIKSGFVPQKLGTYSDPVPEEELMRLAEEQFGVNTADLPTEYAKLPKGMKKMMKKKLDTSENNNDLMSRLNASASYDPIIQYFRPSSETLLFGASRDVLPIESMSLKEIVEVYDREEEAMRSEWVPRKPGADTDKLTFVENKFVKTAQLDRGIEWSQVLYEAGFEKGLRRYLKGQSQAARRHISEAIGYEMLTKKELRKMRKKHKDYEEGLREERRDNMLSLTQAMSRSTQGIGSDIDNRIFDDIIQRRKGGR